MGAMHDVVIVGGGVIGLTTAYFLARRKTRVAVLDQGELGKESSWAGAGILPPGDPASARSPFDRLRAFGAALFPEFSRELKEVTGIDNGYRRCGGLELLQHASETDSEEWHGAGVRVERLDEVQARQLEPELTPGCGPVAFLPDLAQLRNPWHMRALEAACAATGLVERMPNTHVTGFATAGRRVLAVQTTAGELTGGLFLLASGAWTGRLLESLGTLLPIVPVRGQIALLHPVRPVLRRVLMWGARYMVPRDEGRILVGSTEEHAGFDKRPTAAGIAGLLEMAQCLVPALRDATVEQCWAGLRPGSADGLPYLGLLPGFENLYVGAGHFRAGIQLSLGTAQILCDSLLGQMCALPVSAFRVDR
jgi:glycine oxidase